jgi:hypothetical protein
MLIVTKEAYSTLSSRTKAELLAAVFGSPDRGESAIEGDFEWGGRVEFTPGEVEAFMEAFDDSSSVTRGLRVIAENGPRIHASMLDQAGVDDYSSFQRSTTRRVRTVTGGKAYLLAWDDWAKADDGVGHYAVTPATHRSLCIYFNLD